MQLSLYKISMAQNDLSYAECWCISLILLQSYSLTLPRATNTVV